MQHTPAPWHFVPSSDARIPDRITNAAGSSIVSGSIGFDPDARLICAAPDLLRVLMEIVESDEAMLTPAHRQAARSAINDAT